MTLSLPPINPLSVVSLLLTLCSLLGTFFYIQLSQWRRDVLVLGQKSDRNRSGGTPEQRKAMREVAAELVRLHNLPTYIVNGTVIVLVVVFTIIAIALLLRASDDPVFGYLLLAFLLFLLSFVGLSWYLLGDGRREAQVVERAVKALRDDGKLELP